MRILAILTVLAWLAGCASPAPSGPTLAAAGDARGGTIPNGAADMAASMNTVRSHCEQFGKKGMITHMKLPAEGGLITFECH